MSLSFAIAIAIITRWKSGGDQNGLGEVDSVAKIITRWKSGGDQNAGRVSSADTGIITRWKSGGDQNSLLLATNV